MIRVPPEDLAVGKRLPYDVFDERGAPLLLRGQQIASDARLREIQECGLRRSLPRKFESGFAGMSQLLKTHTEIEKDFLGQADDGRWLRRMVPLTRDLIELSDWDPDAAFANIHLEIHYPYSVVHQMMAALVISRLALARGLDAAQRFSLVAAGLSHDIGVLAMRKELAGDEALSDEQRARLRRHSITGVQILHDLGVDDQLWLDAVRDHHEYLDGSGYLGKKGDELSLAARIISLADSYSAMLRPRPYRDRVLARTALETLYANEAHRYDGELVEHLIWDLGFYPPGSLLRRANQEIAVSVRNTPGVLDSPCVASLTDSRGRPLTRPLFRDTNLSDAAIIAPLDPAMAARSARLLDQCWSPRDA